MIARVLFLLHQVEKNKDDSSLEVAKEILLSHISDIVNYLLDRLMAFSIPGWLLIGQAK